MEVNLDNVGQHWFVMRDLSHSHAKWPAYKLLADKDVEVFTPMQERIRVRNGRRIRVECPVIMDLLFVYATKEEIDPLVGEIKNLQYRYKRGGYLNVMTVSDAEMRRFIQATGSSEQVRYFMPNEITSAMLGRRVRIVGGHLDNCEGRLLLVRGSAKKRLLIELPGLLAAGVEVDKDYIQLID